MIIAPPPPEIVARLTGPTSTCVVSLQHTDAEAGDPTTARCGAHSQLIARDYHGDSVSRLSRCSVMLMIESVRLPRLLHVSNCRGPLRVHRTGEIWTRQMLAAGVIAPSRLDRVIYYPIRNRPACYRISIAFTLPGTAHLQQLAMRSATRCYP